VVGTFLIGCALLLLVVGCAGTRSEAPQKEKGHTEATKEKQGHTRGAASEEDRCGGTRTFDRWGGPYITNDVPGCPNGGLLEGTDERDKLWPARPARTRYMVLVLQIISGEGSAATSCTVGQVTTS
jgi:hypothetical protein